MNEHPPPGPSVDSIGGKLEVRPLEDGLVELGGRVADDGDREV